MARDKHDFARYIEFCVTKGKFADCSVTRQERRLLTKKTVENCIDISHALSLGSIVDAEIVCFFCHLNYVSFHSSALWKIVPSKWNFTFRSKDSVNTVPVSLCSRK